MIIFYLIPIIPLLVYLMDGYYEKDTKKGLLHIAVFIAVAVFGIVMLTLIGWTFALWTPILLLFVLSIKPKNPEKS